MLKNVRERELEMRRDGARREAAIRAAELAARQSQKEVEAAAREQANRDWEGGRK